MPTDEPISRKLSAILLADVVGFSQLMGQDEAGTLKRLKSLRLDCIEPVIAAHHGRVVKLMGDGILAEFPSVVEAVSCASEVQNKTDQFNQRYPNEAPIELRIGINLGDVIIEGDDIYGDGVNVAARLEQLAEPGGICISGMVYDALGNKLPLVFESLGEQQVKNIAQPVRTYRIRRGERPGPDDRIDQANPKPGRKMLIIGAALSALALIFAAWLLFDTSPPRTTQQNTASSEQSKPATRLSIAVLPFANLSGEAEQEYFSDGITNDIITDLSQLSSLPVIASNSVFVYKNNPVRVQQVASELGVSHVLEGSVQKAGNRVRINAQLIDASSGHHLWAERFDRDLVNIFRLQDEVSQRIVDALAIELTPDEQKRLERTRQVDPQAYDLLLKGLESFRRFTAETNAEARELFKRAIALDPEFARAHADVALTHAMDIQFGWSEDSDALFASAFDYANRALELDDSQIQALFTLSALNLTKKEHDKARDAAQRLIALHPSYADGYAQYAQLLNYAGQPEEALDKLGTAMDLNPKHSFFYTWIEGHANMLLGNVEQAEKLFLDVIERNALFPGAHLTLTALYANENRIEDAQWQAAEILNLRPDFSLANETQRVPYRSREHLDYYINGLTKAGLPE